MWAMSVDIDALVDVVGSLEAVNGVTEVRYETLSNRPDAGTAGRFSILSDEQRVTIDDGNQWRTVGAHSHDDLTDVSEEDHRSNEQVRDLAGGMAGTALQHDDANDSINVVREDVEDWIGSLVSGQGNISVTYDDGNDALLVDTSGLNQEEVKDAVAGLLSAGDNLSWNYDDSNDVLTVSLSGPITGVQLGTSTDRLDAYLGSADVESLSVGQLTRDGKSIDRSEKLIETWDPSNNTPSYEFTNIPTFDAYILDMELQNDSGSADILMRFNGDGGSTGNYTYWDETGTKQPDENEILIMSLTTGFARVGGEILVDTPLEGGICIHNATTPGRADRVYGFSQKGGYHSSEALNAIEIFVDSGNIQSETVVRLYGIAR